MTHHKAASYADALATLIAARESVEGEFVEAKAARQSDPSDEAAKARYVAARDALQDMRAADRAAQPDPAQVTISADTISGGVAVVGG